MSCALPSPRLPSLHRLLALALAGGGCLAVGAHATPSWQAGVLADLQRLATERALTVADGARVVVQVGQPDPRLRLAPCEQIQAFTPPGVPAAGRTRLGLRCERGATLWKVSVPVTVQLWRPALVARGPLAMGTPLDAEHLDLAEVDTAATAETPFRLLTEVQGRQLARPLDAGEPLRPADLKARQWFAAGDTVRVVALGAGWRIVTEGQAVSAGIEGRPARVKTEQGRLLTGKAVAEREMELRL